jgi:hypothetical protein
VKRILTEAEEADQVVRRHLAAMLVLAQEGTDGDVARLARSEMCRLVSAICTALGPHQPDGSGSCGQCGSPTCLLLNDIRRALLPVRLP